MSEQVKRLRDLLPANLKPPLAFAIAEEFARELATDMAEQIPKPKAFKTEIIDLKTSRTISSGRTLLIKEIWGEGVLNELVIIADSTSFLLSVEWDNQHIDRTYTQLSNFSGFVGMITADSDEDTGNRIVRITGVRFLRHLRVELTASGSVTISSAVGTMDVHAPDRSVTKD